MKTRLTRCLPFLLVALGSPLAAEDAPAATPKGPPPPPPEARQFDFWVGEWEVAGPKGKTVGHSRIELILGGRAIQEHWSGAGGFSGTSLNVYDAEAGRWRQFWVDGTGGVLQLSGGIVEGRMVLESATTAGGTTTIDRITWTPNPDGSVRQLWEKSTDNRQTWTVAFDGHYTRAQP